MAPGCVTVMCPAKQASRNPTTKGLPSVRSVTGRTPGARAGRRVLLAVTSTALAAGVMAGTATMATASTTSPAARTAEPVPGVPPFFAGIVTEDRPSTPGRPFVDVLNIFISAKGLPAATVRAPGQRDFTAVSILGDDQTFVAADLDSGACTARLWKFTIDAAGTPSALSPLPLPPFNGEIERLTASADGTTMAFTVDTCHGVQFGVIHLDSGQVTRWDAPPRSFEGALSLTADGSVLGFTLDPDEDNPDSVHQVWTKPTDAPAGPLLKGAHQVPVRGASIDGMVLSPAGDQFYAEIKTPTPDGLGPVTLSLATTSTGDLVRQIAQIDPGGENFFFPRLALDNSGQHMLAYGSNPGPGHADVEEIDLSSGQTLTWTIARPVIDGPLSSYAW
jgi:hypothetical protein